MGLAGNSQEQTMNDDEFNDAKLFLHKTVTSLALLGLHEAWGRDVRLRHTCCLGGDHLHTLLLYLAFDIGSPAGPPSLCVGGLGYKVRRRSPRLKHLLAETQCLLNELFVFNNEGAVDNISTWSSPGIIRSRL